MTKSQVDKLGERLKAGNYSDDDLRLLDEYRQSFTDAYELVVQKVAGGVGSELTGRRIKSTPSIIAKLQRQSTKLTQVQDIAGCRIIVADISEQDNALNLITAIFDSPRVVDRRQKPSHGYRAVHVVATIEKKPVEIQIRTQLQHLWGQLSEQLSDAIDPAIKYGQGPELQVKLLSEASGFIARIESMEELLHLWTNEGKEVADKRKELVELQKQAREIFSRLAVKIRTVKDQHDFSN